jgi:hypothetical protein
LVFFPLVLCYAATLLLAAWPRLLSPSQTPTVAQLFAQAAMHALGVYAGQEVFQGQGDLQELPRRTCVQIAGVSADGERHLVYDDFSECDGDVYTFWKPPLRGLYEGTLVRALERAHGLGPVDLGQYPLTYLLAITDYYCFGAGRDFVALAIRHRAQTTSVRDGKLSDAMYFGGSRWCAEPTWFIDPLPAFADWSSK